MRPFIIFLIILQCYFCKAQKVFSVSPYVTYLAPAGQPELVKDGLDYYPFSYQHNPYPEAGLTFDFNFKNDFNWGFGFSAKHTERQYAWTVYDPLNVDEVFLSRDEVLVRNMLGLHLGIGYSINNKWRLSGKVELNDPLLKWNNSVSRFSPRSIAYTVSQNGEQTSYNIDLDDIVSPSGSPYDFMYGEFKVSYQVISNLEVFFVVQKNIGLKEDNMVHLKAKGNNLDFPDGPEVIFNDVRVTSDFFGLGLGLQYRFDIYEYGKAVKDQPIRERLLPGRNSG